MFLSTNIAADSQYLLGLLLSAFPLLAQLPSSPPTDSSTTLPPSPVLYIRDLLTSQDPNDHYIFLSCLGCIDPIYWAGTTPEIPPVLEAWEVERVMQLLESSDALIRRKVGFTSSRGGR